MTSLPVLQKYGEVFLLFDNHFTYLVFWILHEMDMMKP